MNLEKMDPSFGCAPEDGKIHMATVMCLFFIDT